MRHLRLALATFAAALTVARAQDEEKNRPPPVEIPDFSNLDDFIYTPRSTLRLGFRAITGAKVGFFGTGKLTSSLVSPGPVTGGNLTRVYHDGAVNADSRTVTRVDADGNPIINPTTGAAFTDPIAPDGRTNSWNYISSLQGGVDGAVAFHTYAADIIDPTVRSAPTARNFGMELTVDRDMGKIGRTRASWSLVAGMSINDLAGKADAGVLARLTTLTDLYSLNGRVLPGAPFSSPSTSSVPVTDSNGNAVTNDDGSAQTASVDVTLLLPNQPDSRGTKTANDASSVHSLWKLRGAYYTFRAGPTLLVPISARFRATVSAGAALVYSGSTYTVTQTYTPETGAQLADTSFSTVSKLLPGYFADATLQFDITERTGLYAGAILQGAGSYTQGVNSDAAHYNTRVDFTGQRGLRAGMTYRF
ncbi:MAG: hypothetical protein RLZZ15_2048 [Verrucomicrobiota bacterium]|jgi:hypothetical protein